MGEFLSPLPENLSLESENNKDGQLPWQARINRIRERSGENLQEIKESLLAEGKNTLTPTEVELRQISGSLKISINLRYEALRRVLQEGRYKPRTSQIPKWLHWIDLFLDGQKGREEILGIRPRQTKKDPPIVYGALISNNNKRDQIEGGAWWYGDCFLVLKQDVMKRSTFSYDDSYGGSRNAPVVFEWASMIKYWRDKNEANYIEAQIAGGVTIDDVEEIRIPIWQYPNESDADFTRRANQFFFSWSEAQKLIKDHPDIKITLVKKNHK